MTTALIPTLEIPGRGCRTREQAAELLEALRALYQLLPAECRNQVKADILELGKIQSSNRPL